MINTDNITIENENKFGWWSNTKAVAPLPKIEAMIRRKGKAPRRRLNLKLGLLLLDTIFLFLLSKDTSLTQLWAKKQFYLAG